MKKIRVTFPEPPTVKITAGAGTVLDTDPSSSGITVSRVIRVSGPSPARATITRGKGKPQSTNSR